MKAACWSFLYALLLSVIIAACLAITIFYILFVPNKTKEPDQLAYASTDRLAVQLFLMPESLSTEQ